MSESFYNNIKLFFFRFDQILINLVWRRLKKISGIEFDYIISING